MADFATTIAEAIKGSGFSISGKSTHPSLELAQHIAKAIEENHPPLTHVHAVDTCVEDGVYLFANLDDATAFHEQNSDSYLTEEPLFDRDAAAALLQVTGTEGS